MEMKHTPGPWKYEGGYDPLPHDYCCSTERISAGGVTIAEVATCEDDTCPGVREGWMNARLIAAAPELLDALRGLINCHTGAAWQTADVQRRWWLAADAAVKKATGRA